MNTDQLVVEIPYRHARLARDAYRAAVRLEHATEADRQLFEAYRAVAAGRRVLDINDVLQKAGVDLQGRPKLAICRADATWGHFYFNDRDNRGEYWFAVRDVNHWGRGAGQRPYATIGVPRDVFPTNLTRQFVGRARVPFIPPQHRPKHRLHNYHILWEAEWDRQPPVDPLLLKHLRGPFFAVLAAWDLTALEQGVMRGM